MIIQSHFVRITSMSNSSEYAKEFTTGIREIPYVLRENSVEARIGLRSILLEEITRQYAQSFSPQILATKVTEQDTESDLDVLNHAAVIFGSDFYQFAQNALTGLQETNTDSFPAQAARELLGDVQERYGSMSTDDATLKPAAATLPNFLRAVNVDIENNGGITFNDPENLRNQLWKRRFILIDPATVAILSNDPTTNYPTDKAATWWTYAKEYVIRSERFIRVNLEKLTRSKIRRGCPMLISRRAIGTYSPGEQPSAMHMIYETYIDFVVFLAQQRQTAKNVAQETQLEITTDIFL